MGRRRIIFIGMGVLILIGASVAVWLQMGKKPVAEAEEPILSAESRPCYACHLDKTPAISKEWAKSKHAAMGTGCHECHD